MVFLTSEVNESNPKGISGSANPKRLRLARLRTEAISGTRGPSERLGVGALEGESLSDEENGA